MTDLRALYQELIIDHGRQPRNFGQLPEANLHKEGFNPLCGDRIFLHIYECNGVIEKIKFEGTGCAISMASASMLTEALQGKNITEITDIFSIFHELVTVGTISSAMQTKLGKLAVLGGVSAYPARVKCATLAWHTLQAALADDAKPISTE